MFGTTIAIAYKSRYYINPYNIKIEPILTDTTRSNIASQKKMREFMNNYNILYKNFFQTKEFQKKYFQIINEYRNNIEKIEKKFVLACQDFGMNCQNLVDLDLIRKNIEYIYRKKVIFFKIFKIII